MTTIIYDATFEGLLTVVFEIYERKLLQVKLHKEEFRNGALFEEVLTIGTDEIKAKRVLKGLKERLSSEGIKRLYITHMAEMPDSDIILLGYIRHVFDSERNIEEDYGNKYVLRLSELTKMIGRERHRMEAFIRFQKLSDETFYAAIEPDFNVLPLLIKHFRDRYADQKWIIYDLKRKYGIYYDLEKVEYMEVEFSADGNYSKLPEIYFEDEQLYQHLWKNYFNSVNIPSRKNLRLHLRHIPKRYWKHLTEKI